MDDLTVTILAGGQSRRMGQEKAFLPWQGQSLIAHILQQTKEFAQTQHIITNKPDAFSWLCRPMFADLLVGKGALGGLYTAVAHSPTPYTAVLACDMPFVDPLVWHRLWQLRQEAQVILPCWNGRFQPFHALYHRSCLPLLETALHNGILSVRDGLTDCSIRWVTDDEIRGWGGNGRCFTNLNTPQDVYNKKSPQT